MTDVLSATSKTPFACSYIYISEPVMIPMQHNLPNHFPKQPLALLPLTLAPVSYQIINYKGTASQEPNSCMVFFFF
jgi:hypothetical protein